MAVAVALGVATGLTVTHPWTVARPVAARPAPPALVLNSSFGDADHGSVSLLRPGAQPTAYVTADGGRTWRHSGELVVHQRSGVELAWPVELDAPAGPRISRDGGRTWRPIVLPDTGGILTSPPVFLDRMHGWLLSHRRVAGAIGYATSLWRTEDGGATWRRLAGEGIPDAEFAGPPVFADQRRGAMAVSVAGAFGLLATADGGDTWRRAAEVAPARTGWRVTDVWPVLVGGRMVAVEQAAATDAPALGTGDLHLAVLRSDDAGATWAAPVAGPDLAPRFAASPVVDARGRILLMGDRRLWASDDAGATWTARVLQAPADLAPDRLVEPAGAALFAAGGRATALLRSTDGGVHWDPLPLPGARTP